MLKQVVRIGITVLLKIKYVYGKYPKRILRFKKKNIFMPRNYYKIPSVICHSLYPSPDIIMTKSRTITWAGYVVRKGECETNKEFFN
jgi:hypothetical protein